MHNVDSKTLNIKNIARFSLKLCPKKAFLPFLLFLCTALLVLSCKDLSDSNDDDASSAATIEVKVKEGQNAEATESAVPIDLNEVFDVTGSEIVSWSLKAPEDKDKASITPDGTLIANEAGTITLVIRSTTDSSVTKEVIFTIKKREALATDVEPTAIAISFKAGKSAEARVGDAEFDLHTVFDMKFSPENTADKRVSWSLRAEDEAKADLGRAGMLKPKAAGTIMLTVTSKADSSVTGMATFTIKPEPVLPTAIAISLKAGKTAVRALGSTALDLNTVFDVTFTPENTTDKSVSWSLRAEDADKASLTSDGMLTAKAVGTITLVVSSKAKDDVKTDKVFTINAISDLQKIINAAEIPAKSDLSSHSQEVQDALGPIAGNSAKTLGVLYVSVSGGTQSPKDGSTWQKAYAAADLKTAIDAAGTAASASNPYLVIVAPGTYAVTARLSMKNNVAILGAFDQDGNPSATTAIFDGDDKTQVFNNSRLDNSAVLYGVTITKGTAANGGGMANYASSPSLTGVIFSKNTATENGGGMYIDVGSPRLTKVTFTKNKATENGGGMFNGDSSNPTLKEVTFSGNAAVSGGGMYSNGDADLTDVTFSENTATGDVFGSGGAGMYIHLGSPRLTKVTFTKNKATENGGGIYIADSTSSTLKEVTFSGNAAKSGGGMYSDGDADFTDVTFSENTAANGAGMYIHLGNPRLTEVTFTENTAKSSGGGMYIELGSPSLTKVTFTKNKATTYGGGMVIKNGNPGLTKVTFTENTATKDGGGMVIEAGNASLKEVTFTENTAVSGGGMVINSGSPRLTKVTFTKNTATGDVSNSGGGGMYIEAGNPSLSLTEVTFTKNTATNDGGGMFGFGAPSLTKVTFTKNTASDGGGMYIRSGNPSLTEVTFTENTANDGGGMFIQSGSSSLTKVTFTENTATRNGGGIYIRVAEPILTQVAFTKNTATNDGGGMYIRLGSPSLIQVTFTENTATKNGGGMLSDSDGQTGPTIVNSIFWGNTGTSNAKSQIYILNRVSFSGDGVENLSIHNSVVEGGIAGFGYKTAPVGGAVAVRTNIISSDIITTDPKLSDYTFDLYTGASVTIPAIGASSSAINMGLYVRKKDKTFYYSEDASTWYTGIDATGLITSGTPPNDAIDLTAKDITGYTRTGRPDIGVYEFR